MLFKQYYFINSLFIYIELNNYLIGNYLDFFKYKLINELFIFFDGQFFSFFYYFFFSSNLLKWKFNAYLFFNFLSNHLFNKIRHLKLEGRGYKLYYFINYIILKLGYSHLCYYLLPLNIYFTSKKKKFNYKMISHSNDKAGNLLFKIQSFRIPNRYKRKGIYIV